MGDRAGARIGREALYIARVRTGVITIDIMMILIL